MPRALAGVRHMQHTPAPDAPPTVQSCPARSSAKVGQPRWSATTVKLGPFGRQFQDGLDEIPPVKTIEPGGTHHQGVLATGQRTLLAGQFGRTVDAHRMGRVGFNIRARAPAVEYVVGGNTDEPRSDVRAAARATRSVPFSIHRQGQGRIPFSPIHIRVARRHESRLPGTASAMTRPQSGRVRSNVGKIKQRQLMPAVASC
jgi:hypothetical protein